MKKNDVILVTSIILYSFLFYRQSAGINFLIFSILLIVLVLVRDKEIIKQKSWLLASRHFVERRVHYALRKWFIRNCQYYSSFCALSAFSIKPKTSIILSLCFSAMSIVTSFVFMILDAVERADKKIQSQKEKEQNGSKAWLYISSCVVVLLFFLMYKSSNPLFDNFTKKINFDFISARWLLFTISGLFLLYGFFYHKVIPFISEKDESMPGNLAPGSNNKNIFNLSIENENRSGLFLFVSLNVLLLVVNLLDANFIFIDSTLPAGLNYSQFVHQGTFALILSIIIAILIILFYFRGELNFYKDNKKLKLLAYLWILQNAFMIFSTAYRNNLYIAEYNLTYKRIGVYVWLLLALIGLITTFVKIFRIKSNWYLFRSNGWLFYTTLLVSCFFNWDVIVAGYNIQNVVKNNKAIDKYYLLYLSDKTLPQLLSLNDSVKNIKAEGAELRYSESDDTPAEDEFKNYLDVAVYDFFERMEQREWKSWSYYDGVVHNQIIELNRLGKINSFDLHGQSNVHSLAPVKQLDHISKLDLSGIGYLDVQELNSFRELVELNLSGSGITSLRTFPQLNKLRSLDLSNNIISNLTMIRNAPNLEQLNISGDNNTKDFTSLLALKKLKRLIIGTITRAGFDTLHVIFPNTEIIATIIN